MEFRIRPARPEDADDINVIRVSEGVCENILALPSERVTFMDEWLEKLSDNDHVFVAEAVGGAAEGLVVGLIGIHVNSLARLSRSAGFGLMVHPGYQGKGVGGQLLDRVLDLADNWLMLARVELSVFCDNERAVSLYSSRGFVKEGVKRCYAIRNGKLADAFMMARIIEN